MQFVSSDYKFLCQDVSGIEKTVSRVEKYLNMLFKSYNRELRILD